MLALVLAALVNHTPPPAVREGVAPPPFAQLLQARGRTVVINFWASWCKPCTDELKYFTAARDEFGKQIVIITISSEPHDVAASYLRLWNIDLPLIEDLDGSISKLYQVPPVPLTVVVDPDGTVGHISVGELDNGELRAAIVRALATPAAGSPSPGVLR
jgi:peroxiredoxin